MKYESTSRIEYVDIAKAIAIFLVIMGHAVSVNSLGKTIIYSFHMPLFFILSGIVTKKADTYNFQYWKKLIDKKISVLLVPYIIWGCIYAEYSFKNLVLIAYGTRETLNMANSLTSLWFLPVLFLSGILIELFICIFQASKIKLTVIAVVCFVISLLIPHNSFGYPLGADVALMATFMLLFGYLSHNILDMIATKRWVHCIAIIISIIMLFLGVRFGNAPQGYVLMANAEYGNPLLFVLAAIGGSVLTIFVAMILSKIRIKKDWIVFVGQNTFGIFLIHKPFIGMCQKIMAKVGFNPYEFFCVILVSLFSLVASCIVVTIVNHYVPALTGKWSARK